MDWGAFATGTVDISHLDGLHKLFYTTTQRIETAVWVDYLAFDNGSRTAPGQGAVDCSFSDRNINKYNARLTGAILVAFSAIDGILTWAVNALYQGIPRAVLGQWRPAFHCRPFSCSDFRPWVRIPSYFGEPDRGLRLDVLVYGTMAPLLLRAVPFLGCFAISCPGMPLADSPLVDCRPRFLEAEGLVLPAQGL